jgi:ceramide glucosyltransferase
LVGAVVEVLRAVLLALVALSLLSTVLSHLFTWYYFSSYDRRFPTKGVDHAPPVSIIKPTKGVDQAALDNFRSFCEQDYPNDYEILFCVEGSSDPSVPVLRRVMQEYPDVDVRLIFSDPEERRAIGKQKNTIAGYAASSYDVIVFSDDDTHAPSNFLREAVASTENPKVGLSFGAPAYEGPEDWGAAMMSVSTNAFVLRLAPMCLFGAFDGALGITMVVRREVIEEVGGLKQFGLQVADDLPLARAIRNKGYRIHLLKQPARVVNRRYGFKRWWSHLHRWLVIIRHYWPNKFWITSLVDLALWWVIFRLALSLLRGDDIGLDIYLLAAVLGTSVVSAAVTNVRFVRDQALWRYLWVVPVQELLRLPLVIYSRLTNEILWRGRRLGINPDCTVRLVDEYDEKAFG